VRVIDAQIDQLDLVCPETRRALRSCTLAEADARIAGGRTLVARSTGDVPPVGRTGTVLVRDGDDCAYPVVDGIPVLLGPEKLVAPDHRFAPDLADRRYAEAYLEMAHYNQAADAEPAESTERRLSQILTSVPAGGGPRAASFPDPWQAWLDATFEPASQSDAFRHLAPVRGKAVVQLGGKGVQAVKFLLAGARQAWAISPMLGEVAHARRLARHLGVEDRLRAVVAVAEELPLPDAGVDAIYAGGTVHHMVTALALRECARVLAPDGRFAAVEPWKGPLYDVGIRIFGKQEDVPCRPLTAERAAPLLDAFEAAEIVHHGALTRYPLIALSKLGVPVPLGVVRRLTLVDDAFCSLAPALRRRGSSAALLATRGGG
jgi:SAM-dependent methyltransferase/uncharacterized protein YbaR (Trm112 family)